MNETSGTTLDNAEGTATYDLTTSGTPTLNQTGPITDTASILFDGVNDYASDAYNAAYFPDQWTFEIRAKPSTGANFPVIDWTNGSATDGWALHHTSGNTFVLLGDTRVIWHTHGNSTGWSHLIVTYDGAVLCLYVDGALCGQVNATVIDPAAGTMYFAWSGAGSTYWNGYLSSAALYSRAISDREAADWHNDAAATSVLRRGAGAYIGAIRQWPSLDAPLSYAATNAFTGSIVTTYRTARL
jgi:hypothetical protein